jgi:hypothetical protein
MQNHKRYLRLLGLTAMLLLAAGAGPTGAAPIHQKRERLIDAESPTEQVDEQVAREYLELGQE